MSVPISKLSHHEWDQSHQTPSTVSQMDQISNLKEATQGAANQLIGKGSNLPEQDSKELKDIICDQMVLHKFKETTITRRQRESSFRETVCNPIVFTVDVAERQILKASN